jgi:hypothetical protein
MREELVPSLDERRLTTDLQNPFLLQTRTEHMHTTKSSSSIRKRLPTESNDFEKGKKTKDVHFE